MSTAEAIAALEQAAADLPAAEAPALLGRVEAVRALLWRACLARGESPQNAADPLLTPDEAAAFLKVPPSWIYERTRTGRLPCVKLGHYTRLRVEDLRAYREDEQAIPVRSLGRRKAG